MSNANDGSLVPKLFASFDEAWTAANKFTFDTHGQHFVGTLFEQGGRHMFSTAMPFEKFIAVAEANSSVVRQHTEKRGDEKIVIGTVGDSVEEIAETTNRPVDKGHVRAISKYIS